MVGTHAPPEGSVTVSLRELQRLEEERLKTERDARRREREAVEAARREAEKREEDSRRARERREEEAWVARAQTEREEVARVAAIERAIVERARTEAAAKAVSEEKERDHRRQLELAAATGTRRVARARRLLVTLGAGLLLGPVAYAALLAPRWEGRLAAADAQLTVRDETIATLRANLAAGEKELGAARNDLAGAMGRVATLEAETASLRRDQERANITPMKHSPAPNIAHPAPPGFDTHCDPSSHDPLCASFGR